LAKPRPGTRKGRLLEEIKKKRGGGDRTKGFGFPASVNEIVPGEGMFIKEEKGGEDFIKAWSTRRIVR